MKSLVLLLFLGLSTSQLEAQTVRVKRKFCKTYQGEIPAYRVQLGEEMVEIPSCKLELTLTKDSIIMQLGNLSMRNTYQLEKTDNPKEILILVARDNSDIPERMILKTNEKVIIRKGIFPQPEVKLIKVKKSN
jgi:hypothetical protein